MHNDRPTNDMLETLLALIVKAKYDADKLYGGHQTGVGIFFNEQYDKIAKARNWIEEELALRL